MKYNTELSKLIIPEYGRHIHQIIDTLCLIEDRKKRNEQAEIVIQIMGNLNPYLRDVIDFRHKLWDHLLIMSNYKLDVDSPYPKPVIKKEMERPKIIENRQGTVKKRHYGGFVIEMLKKVTEMKDDEKKKILIKSIANQMKRSYVNWNKSNVLDQVIFNEIEMVSEGKIKIPEETVLDNVPVFHRPPQNKNLSRKKHNPRQKKHFK